MTNTLPTFIHSGGGGFTSSSPATLSTTGFTFLAGDLVIASFYSADQWSIGAPWNIAATCNAGGEQLYLAWTYVTPGSVLPAAVLTRTAGASNNFSALLFQFRNAKISAAIGNTSQASDTANNATTRTISGISAGAANSLVFLATISASFLNTTEPPSGWSNVDIASSNLETFSKALTNGGDATGTVTFNYNSAPTSYYLALMLEILGATPAAADKYFNGLRFNGLAKSTQQYFFGSEKYWFNGLPISPFVPLANTGAIGITYRVGLNVILNQT